MYYTKLGNSDLSVSRICLGCMGFGNAANGQHSWTIDEEHSREIIKRALELGVNFFDTAIGYQSGTSEQYVGSVDNMEQYDVIFLGYPIWHGQAPKIMYTFVESYDLSGKTIVPFCTSGSSGIGSSATNLAAASTGAEWRPGNRFSGSASQDTVTDWVNGLDINRSENPNG